jgi:hypothetical protein
VYLTDRHSVLIAIAFYKTEHIEELGNNIKDREENLTSLNYSVPKAERK